LKTRLEQSTSEAGKAAQRFDIAFPTRHWHRLDDGRMQCDVCPRYCKLHEGQRGFCFRPRLPGRRDRA
jgi:hypothetical protein